MRNKEIKDLTFAAILIAMTVLFSLPYLVFTVGTVAFTIAHIPVLVGAIILGKKYGAILGTVMGLTSMVIAIFMLGPNAPFTNPLLSVLPRAFFGWIVYIIYRKFTIWFGSRPLAVGLTMAISTLIHSIVVLSLLYIFAKTGFYFTASDNPISINQNILPFIIGVLGTNSILEIGIAVLVGTPIILVMDEVIKKEE